MAYLHEVQAARGDPESLEDLYQTARQERKEDAFKAAILSCYRESPEDVLYAAWYYRLQRSAQAGEAKGRAINWKLAIPLSAITGLIFWILSNPRFEFSNGEPFVLLVWALVGGCAVIAFLAITARRHVKSAAIVIAGLLLIGLYVSLFATSRDQRHYRNLMYLHVPLLVWVGTGLAVLGWRSDHDNRFAFIIKSIEVFITGGLYAGAGGAFVGITVGMFQALDIDLSDEVMRMWPVRTIHTSSPSHRHSGRDWARSSIR
jgi:cytochrome bd-type quinol oxidase subunit 2